MARFFKYDEITSGVLLTEEKISEIASKINELPQFRGGEAVIFGSVAWGVHTWRSDIDVACFFTLDTDPIGNIFTEIFGRRNGWVICNSLMQYLTGERRDGRYTPSEISPSTKDHFRQLAKRKGFPYTEFLKHLPTIPGRKRVEDILAYADKIDDLRYICNWRPLYPGEQFDSFNDLAAVEHFPLHLMRKILGKKNLLPFPDIVPNIVRAFEALPNEKMAKLRELFPSFCAIDTAYKKLVARISQNPDGWTREMYERKLLEFFQELPVAEIVNLVQQIYTRPDAF